jgi:HEAT repeat protein
MGTGLRIGPFRGLMPYLEGDANLFFGRDRERKALKELVLDGESRVTLVTGEVGSGKTSLVRAGLIPQLRRDRWVPIYLECGPEWRQDLGATLSVALKRPVNLDELFSDPLGEVVSASKRFLLVLDHLEQVLWMESEEVDHISQLLERVMSEGGMLVLVVDRGNIHALERLPVLGRIPDTNRIHLERMDREVAGKVMEQTILTGGGYMEAGLPELIAEEAAADGPVLPATLQVVGHAALLTGATRAKRFSRAGGVQALAGLYVERLVARAGGWSARRVLAMLTEHPNPREGRPVGAIAQGCGLALEVTQSTLEALREQGLVAQRADPLAIRREPRYTIIHPFLLQSIRDTVAPVLRGRAQARLSLRRRIHERGVLRPDEMLRVWRYLGTSVSAPEADQVRRAAKVWAAVAAAVVALPLSVLIIIYAVLAGSTFVDTAASQEGVQRVVVRSGRPSLSFAFNISSHSFGQVLVDTGLAWSSIPPSLRRRVSEGALVGDRDEDEQPDTAPYWLQGLWAPLPPVRRGALQILAGDRSGSQLLQRAADSDAERRQATWALALLSGDSPATQKALKSCIKDSRPDVRRMAVVEARRLGPRRTLAVLELAIGDRDNQIRLAATRALSEVSQSGERAVLDLLGQALGDPDLRVQKEAFDQLQQASRQHPVAVYETVRQALAEGGRRSETIESAMQQLVNRVQQRAPKKVAAHLMRLIDTRTDSATRVEALTLLRALADHLDAARVLTVVGRMVNSKDTQVRAAAIPLQARFGNPEEVEEQLVQLAKSVTPRKQAALMRRAAAAGLGLLQDKPRQERLKLLRRLLRDPDKSVREAAMESLVKIGPRGLVEVVKGIKTGHRDVALVALRTVCQDAEPERRIATTILATAWKIKRTNLRGKALGCARKMAAANPRLSLWLADQARLDKNPEVRRAAAEAVALAIKRYGQRVDLLTKFYLRQKDPTIVVAVLEAMTQTPPLPARPKWLFREVSKLITHSDPKVRAATAPLLAIIAPSPAKAAESLEALINDVEPDVVRSATRAAGELEPGRHVARLDKPLARVVAAARSRDAIAALKLARRLRLTRPIKRAAVHPEPDVRAAAVALLAQKADAHQALAVLESALRDPEQALRLAALDAIARQSERLGAPAVDLLERGTHADAPAQRWAAFDGLGRVKGDVVIKKAVAVLKEAAGDRSEERRRLAIRALGALASEDRRAARALVDGALDPAVDVRTEAQAVLAEYLGRHCPVKELADLLVTSERSALQRHLACAALAWSGRHHGHESVQQALAAAGIDKRHMIIRMAANLALALARRQDRPEEVIGWLFGS